MVWHLPIGLEDGGTHLMRSPRQASDLVIAVNVSVGLSVSYNQIIFNTFTFWQINYNAFKVFQSEGQSDCYVGCCC